MCDSSLEFEAIAVSLQWAWLCASGDWCLDESVSPICVSHIDADRVAKIHAVTLPIRVDWMDWLSAIDVSLACWYCVCVCVCVVNFLVHIENIVMEVGFEPTPFRTGALNQRLRPLGHSTYKLAGHDIHTQHTQNRVSQINASTSSNTSTTSSTTYHTVSHSHSHTNNKLTATHNIISTTSRTYYNAWSSCTTCSCTTVIHHHQHHQLQQPLPRRRISQVPCLYPHITPPFCTNHYRLPSTSTNITGTKKWHRPWPTCRR